MARDNDLVVIVEDEEEARTFLTRILEFEGFKALGFPNGLEALHYLENAKKPCLIVMDMRMPVMDGPQLCAALRREPRLAKVPVIAVTAQDPSTAAELSPLRVFRKPVDVDALISVVRQNC